jgi:hypothetical protein
LLLSIVTIVAVRPIRPVVGAWTIIIPVRPIIAIRPIIIVTARADFVVLNGRNGSLRTAARRRSTGRSRRERDERSQDGEAGEILDHQFLQV